MSGGNGSVVFRAHVAFVWVDLETSEAFRSGSGVFLLYHYPLGLVDSFSVLAKRTAFGYHEAGKTRR